VNATTAVACSSSQHTCIFVCLSMHALSQDFIARVKADCRRVGYVETLLGRRRYLPAINSSDTEAR
jgi:hypothetical protein